MVTLRDQPAPVGVDADRGGELTWRQQWAAGQGRFVVPLVVVLAVAAWLAGTMSGLVPAGQSRISLVVIGAACTALSAALPLWQRRRANTARVDAVQAAKAARAELRVALSDTLDPFAHLLGRLTTARGPAKSQLRGEAISLAVAALAGLAHEQRARVCVFLLHDDPPTLRPERFSGRSGAPTASFTADTPGGAGALGIARGAGWLYIPDVAVQAPPFWLDDERQYRCVLLGPLAAAERSRGLLTIDTPEPNALDGIDVALVRLLATLLATALSI